MIEILKITSTIKLNAIAEGILISGITDSTNISKLNSSDPAIQVLIRRIPGMLTDGTLENSPEGLIASLESIAGLEAHENDPFEALFEWSPYTLKIQATGTLGFEDFKFIPRFYLGKRIVALKHLGIFGWRSKAIARLPASQAAAIALCDAFNRLPNDGRDKWTALKALHDLQALASEESGPQLDDYLASEKVVMPESVSLSVDDNGRFATAFPKIDGVEDEEMKRQFLNVAEVQSVYDLETDGGRKRLLVHPDLQKVFRAIKKHGFGMTGSKRKSFYRNPRSILPEDETINPDLIEVIGFGPRVKGIGFPQFVRPITNHSKENWFDRAEGERPLEESSRHVIECEFVNGNTQRLTFDTDEAAKEFLSEMKAAIAAGEQSFEWCDNSIPASNQLLESCEVAFGFVSEKTEEEPREKNRSKILLIHDNEEQIDYREESANRNDTWEVQLPVNLRDGVKLKGHQVKGLQWLQNLIHNDCTKGGLLADEMGLGKTLQLLTLAAWCIESEFKDQIGNDSPPYDPILIVGPLILLDVWKREIDEYFEPGVFQPLEILHGPVLKTYRNSIEHGRELESATESLDLEKVKRNRVVITNYDTVKNYQYSFAKIPWSLVIVDEAQEIKEPSTTVTHALKALNPLFRIASTGTPVETSLTNLWSVMDFVHPGNPLGSMSEFKKEFAGREFDDQNLGQELRKRLGYNSESGLVRRRTKKEVLKDLPEKHFVVKECELDDSHRSLYLQVIAGVKQSKNPQAAALQGLHQISVISQHPFLIEDNPFRSSHKDYLLSSAKLRFVVETLHQIRQKGEKALIFTRSRAMQDILKVVIDCEFGLDVKIVNGSTISKHKYVSNTRTGIISTFSDAPGFQVLLLSPEVAGVGLTITAANHVIHYGRWWNPAKENQATDRAYRIGQTKPVFVYHFIYKDPKGEFETFDEKLHRLLKSREDLADNFLIPSHGESIVQEGLTQDIFGGPEAKSTTGESSLITLKHLPNLLPYEFETLTSLLIASRFTKVLLTPRSRDGGVDVIGISDKELVLIQCKHRTTPGDANGEDAIRELVDGSDFYRESLIPGPLKHLPIKLTVYLSGKADKATERAAKDCSIELIDIATIKKLLTTNKISLLDLKRAESNRAGSLSDLFK